MFLGIRDITHAWGRFTLIGTVVGLITLLLVMLTGLTGGLGAQNTSALSGLDPDRYVFSPTVSFTESTMTGEDLDAWNDIDGVSAVPVGVGMTRLETADGVTSVAVIGRPGGSAVASASLLDAPATVTLGGVPVDIVDTAPDEYYSHAPVVWVDTDTWRRVTHSPDDVVGTVLAADGELDAAGWEAASTRTGTTAVTPVRTLSPSTTVRCPTRTPATSVIALYPPVGIVPTKEELNLDGLEMRECERVRWYVFALGTEVDLHSAHWHGNTGLLNGRRMDVVELLPAAGRVVDMVPDSAGTWMFHCHVNDHITAGMTALYTVTPVEGSSCR